MKEFRRSVKDVSIQYQVVTDGQTDRQTDRFRPQIPRLGKNNLKLIRQFY